MRALAPPFMAMTAGLQRRRGRMGGRSAHANIDVPTRRTDILTHLLTHMYIPARPPFLVHVFVCTQVLEMNKTSGQFMIEITEQGSGRAGAMWRLMCTSLSDRHQWLEVLRDHGANVGGLYVYASVYASMHVAVFVVAYVFGSYCVGSQSSSH